MKLMITGGHPSPALACIDEIVKSHHSIEPLYVGKQYVTASGRESTFEYDEVTARKIRFIPINPGRFTRTFTVATARELAKIPSGIIQALQIVDHEKPDAVLSFGGYIGLAVAIAAYIKHIPVYTHEQTIHPGLANKIISRFAKRVFVSFPETSSYLGGRTVVTGNPIRSDIFKVTVPDTGAIPGNKPVIYITGGSLGSHSINMLIAKIVPELLKDYIIIHQTGNVSEYRDRDALEAIRRSLPDTQSARYHLFSHVMGGEIGYIYSRADLVISRAGANTFFELFALKKPALFIPLPWASHDEQRQHARIYQSEGWGEVFEQDGDPAVLAALIQRMMRSLPKYQRAFSNSKRANPSHAASRILQEIIG